MSYSRNNEDRVLDEIDALVDASLSAGDQSDSWRGDGYRDNHPCPWCREGFHFLPITVRMAEMRAGSYALDEFGQGIVDPNYSYRNDDSGVVCPGSEWKGPPIGDREWSWYTTRFPRTRSYGPLVAHFEPNLQLPRGAYRRLRFVGPFSGWTVSIDEDRVIEEVVSNPAMVGLPGPIRRIPMVVSTTLTVTFEAERPFKNPSLEWLRTNEADIEDTFVNAEGNFVSMKPIKFEFKSFTIFSENPEPNQMNPDWVEFVSDYPIERHPWILEYFEIHAIEREGHESDVVIIDEAHQYNNERLRQDVEEAQPVYDTRGRIIASQEAHRQT